MSINYYKDLDGKIKCEDTILDDLSEMIRDETEGELDDDQVAEAAQEMLEDMVKDGSLRKVKPVKESAKPKMKSFDEFLAEALNKPVEEPINESKEYDFTPEDYEDWVDLKPNSKIVKKIEEFIKDLHHAAKEEAYVSYHDNAEEYEGGKFASYDVLGDLEKNKVVEWCENLDVEDFHTDYLLKKGKDGLQSVLDFIKKYEDEFGQDEDSPGEALYEYYKRCEGLSDAEYKKAVRCMSVSACEKEYKEWRAGV